MKGAKLVTQIYEWIRHHDPIKDNEMYTHKMRRNVKKNSKWWVLGFGLGGGTVVAFFTWLLLHLGGFA